MASNYKKGDSEIRPWGTWEVLDGGESFCVKKIVVNPNGCLSLQSHNHRCENWIIVEGCAQVTLGEQEFEKGAGENIFIPTHTKHRVKNGNVEKLVFIEVQYGANLDENDIVRYEDVYGRV